MENGELNACWDLASGSVYIVVVLMPYRAAVLPTRLFSMSFKSQKLKADEQGNFTTISDQD